MFSCTNPSYCIFCSICQSLIDIEDDSDYECQICGGEDPEQEWLQLYEDEEDFVDIL